MRIGNLARAINADVLVSGAGVDVTLDQVYAGDRISDLLNAASDHNLLITNLATAHLTRVAELMDVPAICIVGGQQPDAAMIAAAREHATVLMVSRCGLFETCGRVYDCLREESRVPV